MMTFMNTATNAAQHVFEIAGLGVAPFRFVGVETTGDRAALNANRASEGLTFTTNLCGGSCDYCGQAISNVCWVLSSDGRRFKVGTDCLEKTGDARLHVLATSKLRAKKLDEKHAKDAARIAAAKTALPGVSEKLAALPHPIIKGRTALDYADFLFRAGGTTGQLRAAKMIEGAQKLRIPPSRSGSLRGLGTSGRNRRKGS